MVSSNTRAFFLGALAFVLCGYGIPGPQGAGGGGSFSGDLSGSDLTDSSDDTVTVDDGLAIEDGFTGVTITNYANGALRFDPGAASAVTLQAGPAGKGLIISTDASGVGSIFLSANNASASISAIFGNRFALTGSSSGTQKLVTISDQGVLAWTDGRADNGTPDLYLRRSAAASTLTVDADGAGAAATLDVSQITHSSGPILTFNGNSTKALQVNNGNVSTTQQLTWTTGLGAITHLLGPSDQSLLIQPGTSQTLTLRSADDNNALSVNNTGVIVSSDVYLQADDRVLWNGGQSSLQAHTVDTDDNTATALVTISLDSDGDWAGGTINVVVRATDAGGTYQIAQDTISFTAVNDGGTVTGGARLTDTNNASGGAVVVTSGSWTSRATDVNVSSTDISIRYTADSGLTVSDMDMTFTATVNGQGIDGVTLP